MDKKWGLLIFFVAAIVAVQVAKALVLHTSWGARAF